MSVNFKKTALLLLLCNLPLGQAAIAEDEQPAEEKKECLAPVAPAITDGRSARKEQIQEMRKAVETYITDNFNYRICLEEEFNILNKLDEAKAKSLKAAVEEALADSLEMDHLVADTFNTQLRIYKSLQE
jgi:cysteinyl-tRNA synthetase